MTTATVDTVLINFPFTFYLNVVQYFFIDEFSLVLFSLVHWQSRPSAGATILVHTSSLILFISYDKRDFIVFKRNLFSAFIFKFFFLITLRRSSRTNKQNCSNCYQGYTLIDKCRFYSSVESFYIRGSKSRLSNKTYDILKNLSVLNYSYATTRLLLLHFTIKPIHLIWAYGWQKYVCVCINNFLIGVLHISHIAEHQLFYSNLIWKIARARFKCRRGFRELRKIN